MTWSAPGAAAGSTPGPSEAVHAAAPLVADLARLLIAPDPDAAMLLLAAEHARNGEMAPLCETLLEPAARHLGDLWSADDCSEYDVTLGLCRLQTAVRRLERAPARTSGPAGPVVLVAPQPGETHLLGAALDAELLWQAGWDMHARFPDSDAALQALLAETWFDVLDLSLSASFRREHWLPRITHTIARARRASRNPALVVVVGGRLFCEEQEAGERVGANLGSASAAQTAPRVLAVLAAQSSLPSPTSLARPGARLGTA
jgi:methanogenic corrinoid protein MtbC1